MISKLFASAFAALAVTLAVFGGIGVERVVDPDPIATPMLIDLTIIGEDKAIATWEFIDADDTKYSLTKQVEIKVRE